MKSKTSLCSAVLFRKDITRFWPIWVGELLFDLFFGVVLLISQIENTRIYEIYQDMDTIILNAVLDHSEYICLSPLLAGWSIVMALCLFLYLTREREAYMLHSFPMKRITMFFSHYLAGLVMLVTPVLLTGVGIILVGVANGLSVSGILWLYMAQALLEILFFYSLSCMVVMLTGNALMSGMIYAVLNMLVSGVAFLYSMLAEYFVYGCGDGEMDIIQDNVFVECMTPIYFFWQHTGSAFSYGEMDEKAFLRQAFSDLGAVAWYLLPAVFFLGLAVFLYQKRPLEAAGDMVAFSWGRPVFRIVFSVCGSMLFAGAVYALVFEEGIGSYAYGKIFQVLLILIVTGVIVFYLMGNMILDKTFFIWKKTSYWRMALLAAVMAAGMFVVKYANFGATPPDQEKIESVAIVFNPYDTVDYSGFGFYGGPYAHITEEAKVKEVYELNKEILEYGSKLDIPGYYPDMDYLTVSYVLKDGRVWDKSYALESGCALSRKLEEWLNEQDICEALFGEKYAEVLPEMVKVYSEDENVSNEIGFDSNSRKHLEQRNDIYQAVLKDLQADRYDVYRYSEEDVLAGIAITMEWAEVGAWDADPIYLNVTKKCTETLKELKKQGIDQELGIELDGEPKEMKG